MEFTNKCQGQTLTRCSVMLYCTIWAHSMVALKLVESHIAAPCALVYCTQYSRVPHNPGFRSK